MAWMSTFLISLGAAWAVSSSGPWWAFCVAALLAGLIVKPGAWKAFSAGFSSIFLLWALAAWMSHSANGGFMAEKMSLLMGLSSPVLLLFISALLGALLGGLSCLTGQGLRNVFSSAS
jgi:hypothetical protein